MHLKNGWTWDPHVGAVCHFRHHPLVDAKRRARLREKCFVVETVNWTSGEGDRRICHFNLYFAIDMASAIALAARMEIEWKEVAEDVVNIRAARDSEMDTFYAVQEHLEDGLPAAISDGSARALSKKRRSR